VPQALRRDDLEHEPIASDRLNSKDFDRIAALVGSHAGIKLPPSKQLMVEGRLRKRVRHLGLCSLTEYCRFLFDEDGLSSELVHLIDAVTTNKTDFFREPEHFVALEKTLVPALINSQRSRGKAKLKFWSAASSNGAEAYTIGMVMADLAAKRQDFQFAVLGTDISTEMLAAGRRAVYPVEMIAPVPPDKQQRYLMRGQSPKWNKEVRIVPELRSRVRFQRLNLMDDTYRVDRDVDVIFLRNVLIYFEKPTQEAVVRRLVKHLRPGGFLILGHSESMIGTNLRLSQLSPGVFQN
jgi:chemotaxis protein methyltransferase CheR